MTWVRTRRDAVEQLSSGKLTCISAGLLICLPAGSLLHTDSAGPAAGESPGATLNRIRSFAPTAAKLADSKGEHLAAIKARRKEEEVAREEREVGSLRVHVHMCWAIIMWNNYAQG